MSMSGRIEEFEAKVKELEKRNKELVADLMRKSAQLSDAEDWIKRTRAELEIVASKSGHNLCHIWIPELLKRALGYTGNFPNPEGMTREEFELGCKFYQDDIFGPRKQSIFGGKMFNRRAVFLDRDGTVVESVIRSDFVKKVTCPFSEDELKFVPSAYSALQKIKKGGFLRILITNQPDVLLGYMDEEVWRKMHERIVHTLGFDDVFMCRHRKEDSCPFKKPSPLMLQAAADKWGIDLSQSWMVGDTDADTKSGRMAGCRVILIDHKEYNRHLSDSEYDYRVGSLVEAVGIILASQ